MNGLLFAAGVALFATPATATGIMVKDALGISMVNTAVAECADGTLTPKGAIIMVMVEEYMKTDAEVTIAFRKGFDAFHSLVRHAGRAEACRFVGEVYTDLVIITTGE